MIDKSFIHNFELLTNSQVGVKLLREIILKLATQGKLVRQNPEEGSALEELLAVNDSEVGQLLNPKTKELHEYPPNWAVASFPNIGRWVGGNGFPTSEQGHQNLDILFCKVSDMNRPENTKFILETTNTIDAQTAKRLKVTVLPKGTVIFPKIGGAIATNKRRIICKPTVMDNNCLGVIPCPAIDSDWLFLLLSSIDMVKYQSGTSIPSLSQRVLDQVTFGVPPMIEQKRIVTKVEELLLLCNELESILEKRESLAIMSRESAVDAVKSAKTSQDLLLAWERIQENWQLVAGSTEGVFSIRQLVQELAVRGVLTNGNQNSANISGNGDRPKFNIPDSWRWVKLGEVIDFVNGYAFKTSEYTASGVGVVRMSDMKGGRIIPDHMKRVSSNRLRSLTENFQVKPGDIVLGMTGATLGKPCINRTQEIFLLNQRIGKCVPKGIAPEYLFLVLAHLERSFMSLSFGTGVNNLSTQQIKESLIPLPPSDEQIQIVKIVSGLFSICDRLESILVSSQEFSVKFARSVVSSSS